MKFIRNRNKQVPTVKERKKFKPEDYEIYSKKYVQSYLRWMYEQNPYFFEYLTTDEITNFFMKEFYHPVWLQYELETNPMKVMTDLTDYIKKYAKNSEQMDLELPIHSLKDYVKPVDMPKLELVREDSGYREFATNLDKDLKAIIDPNYDSIDDVNLFKVLAKKEGINL